jgi:hypothetical protein
VIFLIAFLSCFGHPSRVEHEAPCSICGRTFSLSGEETIRLTGDGFAPAGFYTCNDCRHPNHDEDEAVMNASVWLAGWPAVPAADPAPGRAGPLVSGAGASLSPMLSDEEAGAIRKGLAAWWRGPILLRWIEQLLEDRHERRQRGRQGEVTERGLDSIERDLASK